MLNLPDTAVCLKCGYWLRGLPENRCPECGHAFDPDKPKSWRDSSLPSFWARLWRFLVLPPTKRDTLIIILMTLFFLLFVAQPHFAMHYRYSILLLINRVLSPLYAAYVLKVLAASGAYLAGQDRKAIHNSVGVSRWIILPLCFWAVSATLWFPYWPWAARFVASKPFLEWKANQLARSGKADNRPGIVGLFWVSRIGLVDGTEAKFVLSWDWAIIRDRQGGTWDQFEPGRRHYKARLTGDWYLYSHR